MVVPHVLRWDGSILYILFLSLLVQNSFVSPVSRAYQNVTLLEPETQTRELYIEAESFNVKWKPEKRERCDAKNYTADVGHWHSQVLWDYLLFGCYSILISFQHQHWSSQHIKWTEHRSCVCSVFVPFSINRSLWGPGVSTRQLVYPGVRRVITQGWRGWLTIESCQQIVAKFKLQIEIINFV